jgi:hypothetical protein
MPLSHLVAAVFARAFELGLFVTVTPPVPGKAPVFLFSKVGEPGRMIEMPLDGRHLQGRTAELYIHELCGMMGRCPLIEWPARAAWIAKVLPVFPQLPPGPPPPLQLGAGPLKLPPGPRAFQLDLAEGAEHDRLARLFGVERKPPRRSVQVEIHWNGQLVGHGELLLEGSRPAVPFDDTMAIARRAFEGLARAAMAEAREVRRRFAEIFGSNDPGMFGLSAAGGSVGVLLPAVGPRPSRWRPPVAPLALEFLLGLELEEQLRRLRAYRRGSPPREPRHPASDLAFLARYLSIAGDHARFVADLMVRGGLTIVQVAKIWRDTFEDVAPERFGED